MHMKAEDNHSHHIPVILWLSKRRITQNYWRNMWVWIYTSRNPSLSNYMIRQLLITDRAGDIHSEVKTASSWLLKELPNLMHPFNAWNNYKLFLFSLEPIYTPYPLFIIKQIIWGLKQPKRIIINISKLMYNWKVFAGHVYPLPIKRASIEKS